MESIIKERILDFQQAGIPEYLRRDTKVFHLEDMVTTIAGGRKVGKTYLTYQIIDDLIKNSTVKSLKNVCYLHFDDEALASMKPGELSKIDQVFLSLLDKDEVCQPILFVFDEIHNVQGWENFVLRLKKKKNWLVVVTGSTSELEEDKVARQLRGKTFTNRLYPLSFAEFLRFNGSEIDLTRMSGRDKSEAMKNFDEYMKRGSYPAVAKLGDALLRPLLQNYFNSIVVSDFILNKNIQNPVACKSFLRNILLKNACPYTHKKELNNLKSLGFNLAPKTVSDWFRWAEEVYFIGSVGFNSTSLKRISQNYRKIYSSDWAMANCISGWNEKKTSRILESITYWHLIRNGFDVKYESVGQNRNEIDFIVSHHGKKPFLAIQVCSDLSNEFTHERETKSLMLLCKENPSIKPLILTLFEKTVKSGGIQIRTVFDLVSGALILE